MTQDYFVYNGEQYKQNTVIVVKWFCCTTRSLCDVKAKFIEHDTDKNEYIIEISGKRYAYKEEIFYKIIQTVYDENGCPIRNYKTQNNEFGYRRYSFVNELNIEGVLNAWMIYVLIMAVGTIFYDRILIWVFTSIIFFIYRNKKLKEAGYKWVEDMKKK